ncbi:unnamed protein product [Cuscuta epithymum]|uniref:Uncharacterized protein n=1 Tax=Cuscuta epithymum TaxID=186058 RepID=A0AAV0F202_9ASTE|nr:unnamed protein product [Cuscuta epithymum]
MHCVLSCVLFYRNFLFRLISVNKSCLLLFSYLQLSSMTTTCFLLSESQQLLSSNPGIRLNHTALSPINSVLSSQPSMYLSILFFLLNSDHLLWSHCFSSPVCPAVNFSFHVFNYLKKEPTSLKSL